MSANFFARPAPEVARDLLGLVLLRKLGSSYIGGSIVETEAYTEDDPASHSYRGERPHLASMFGPPAMIYVYRSYGVHWCLNFSTGQRGHGEAVLVRAIAPEFGHDLMRPGAAKSRQKIASGPGRLCAALAITREQDGQHLGPDSELSLWIMPERSNDYPTASGQRIGISKGLDLPWRFGYANHPALSRPFPS